MKVYHFAKLLRHRLHPRTTNILCDTDKWTPLKYCVQTWSSSLRSTRSTRIPKYCLEAFFNNVFTFLLFCSSRSLHLQHTLQAHTSAQLRLIELTDDVFRIRGAFMYHIERRTHYFKGRCRSLPLFWNFHEQNCLLHTICLSSKRASAVLLLLSVKLLKISCNVFW